MRALRVSEIAVTAAELVIGASHSIDLMGFENTLLFHPKRGISFSYFAALADQRLRLRAVLLALDRAIVNMGGFLSTAGRMEERRQGSWKIRTPPFVPPVHMLVVDGKSAMFTDVAGPKKLNEVFFAESSLEVQELSRLFESAWSGTPRLLYLDNLQLLDPADISTVAAVCEEQWQELIRYLARSPENLYQLDSRRFEELVAELLTRDGMVVELTPRSRDGGRDVLAFCDTPVGRHLFYVECKRYSRDNPVDVKIVRELFGVIEAERATAGMVVTTSRFTACALRFRDSVQHRMGLKDYEKLNQWLREHAKE